MEIPKRFDYLEINSDLEEALSSVFDTKENTIIIGNAGTGKSEIIRIISHVSGNDTLFLAPTGTAAVNIAGQTIHSLFKFPPTLITESDIGLNEKTALILNNIKRIVIDEIPMVRVDLFDAIDTSLKYYRGSSEPFGGVQMVIVGDLFQLPPIVKKDSEEERYISDVWGGAYFFNSFAYKGAEWNKIEFTKVYRQKDAQFSSLLNRIRKGHHSDSDLEVLNTKVMPFGKFVDNSIEEDFIYLTAFNKIAERENRKKLDKLTGEMKVFNAFYDRGINPKNFMAPEILELKIGAKVMLLTNTEDWNNGDMGYVEELNSHNISVKLLNGRWVKVEPVKFDEYEYDYDKKAKSIEKKIKGSFIQYPIKLAYALTIHKSQGQTFEGGFINAGKFFAPHMCYVALSRFRDLNKIGLAKKVKHEDIIISEEAKAFMSSFSKRRKRPLT